MTGQAVPSGCLFRNPGSSRVPEPEPAPGHQSDLRNPDLVLMFRQINLAEEADTGIQRIFRAWRSLGYHVPTIDTGTERYEFALHLRYLHLFSDDDRAWLDSLGPITDEAEQLALLIARHDGDVDNFRLRSLSGQHPADATKTLGALRNRGLLTMSGWGRGASHQLDPDRSLLPRQSVSAPAPLHDSTTSRADLAANPGIANGYLQDSPPTLTDSSSPDATLHALEGVVADIAGRKYLDAEVRDATVVRLCEVAPLTSREIALHLGRSHAHVRQIVAALVAAHRLEPVYPDQPTNPGQRYRAVPREPGPDATDVDERQPPAGHPDSGLPPSVRTSHGVKKGPEASR